MKTELHCHTMRYSGCATASPAELMTRMIETGYEAVFITEHDAVWSDMEIAQLREGFPGIRIFPGLERSIGADPAMHVLVLGTSDPRYLEPLTLRELLEEARRQGHLTVLAHPFRWGGAEQALASGALPDALEYRTANQDAERAALAEQAAHRYNLPLVNAGDSHGLGFLNRFWLQTDRDIRSADDIRAIILAGQYRNCWGDGEK